MIKLNGLQSIEASYYLNEAAKLARFSTCLRRRCGSLITFRGTEIIGEGFNSPPANLKSQRRCLLDKATYDKKVTDKTCCIHAEQRAIVDALRRNPTKIFDSRIYFASVDSSGDIERVGSPYCTLCSKLALDVGIKDWVIMQKDGPTLYVAEEYNEFSFNYKGD